MSRSVSIAFLFLAALACLAQADLNWSRESKLFLMTLWFSHELTVAFLLWTPSAGTHLVESTPQDKPNAFFFRSNQPNNATQSVRSCILSPRFPARLPFE